MPELIAPTTRLHTAWLEAHEEWGPGQHEDGFGLGPSDEVDSPTGFAAWLTRLTNQSDPAKTIDVGRHCCTYRRQPAGSIDAELGDLRGRTGAGNRDPMDADSALYG